MSDERTPDEDLLSRRLRALADEAPPAGTLDDLLRERTRRRAGAALAAEGAARPRALAAVERAWDRVVLPLFVAASVVLYLGWAIHTAAGVYR